MPRGILRSTAALRPALGVSWIALGSLTTPAAAQDASVHSDRAETIKVFVTGSNIPSIERESGLPLQIITRDEIERANVQTAFELVNTISAVTGYGTVNENLAFAGSTAPGFAGVGLRGLTTQRTLVLVNGRRIANYAFTASATDINLIPMAAVDRVEVLLDGASAIYGSDAIGGVINFILRQEFQGLEATAQYSAPQQSGGWSSHFNATAGYGSLERDSFNLYGMIDYQRFGALAARERPFSSSYYIPGMLDLTSTASFPGNVRVGGNTLRNPTGNPANGFANPSCAPPASFPTAANPNRCNFDSAFFLNSVNASDRVAATGAFTWQFAAEQQFFVQGLYARNSFTFVAAPTSIQNAFLLPPSSPHYPHDFAATFLPDGQPLNTLWRTVELGGRTSEPITEQWNVVAGAKGTLEGWRYDTALSYGINSIDDRYTSGYVELSKILPLLNSGRVDPFGYNTPEVVTELAATQVSGTVRTGRSSLAMFDAKASKEVFELPAGALAVAGGAELRQWRLTETSSPSIESGDIANAGAIRSFSASRTVWAAFVEASAPLAKGLELDVAVRYDHYSDVGGTTNPKVSLRWQPVKSMLFRASAGTGFRAPGLEALYAPPTFGTTPVLNDPARCPTTKSDRDCLVNFPFAAGGNPNLQNETSTQWGAGAVWSPVPDLTMSADYFDIVVDNSIIALNGQTVFQLCPDGTNGPTCQFIVRGPVDPAYPTLPGPVRRLDLLLFNLGTIRTSGVDLALQYRLPRLDWGQFTVAIQGTYIAKQTQQQPEGYVDRVNHVLQIPPGGPVPYWHHYLTVSWNYGSWAATLTQNFQAGTQDAFPNPGETQLRRVGSYDVWNISGSYSGLKAWQFSAGIKNLANRDPPFTNQSFSANNGAPAGYDPTYANPIGRAFWASVRYAFH